jgi:hypothetical protein
MLYYWDKDEKNDLLEHRAKLDKKGGHMIRSAFRLHRLCRGVVLYILLSIWALSAVYGAAVESLDELHQKAKKEGGKLTIYAALSARSMEVILPAFMKRFPGVTIDHIDATADKLLARIVAEALC